jgi:hypothetical protein
MEIQQSFETTIDEKKHGDWETTSTLANGHDFQIGNLGLFMVITVISSLPIIAGHVVSVQVGSKT